MKTGHFEGSNARCAPLTLDGFARSLTRAARIFSRGTSRVVKHAANAIVLHGSVALLQVKADEMSAFAVGNHPAPHEAGDVPHTASEMQGDLAFGFPVFAGPGVGLCCSVHNNLFDGVSAFRRRETAGREPVVEASKSGDRMATGKSRRNPVFAATLFPKACYRWNSGANHLSS